MSLVGSTILPDEVVLVEDGPIGESLRRVIDEFRIRLPIRSVPLKVNSGLPSALNAGLVQCSHDIVARFDTDDICESDRFARQIAHLEAHPEVTVLGGAVQEFDLQTGKKLGVRAPPLTHDLLRKFSMSSSPLNHPAVMYRKSAVLSVGAYPTHMTVAFEDYALWIRLMVAGYRLENLPGVLVQMRAGTAQAMRRTGLRYAKQEISFALEIRRSGFFSGWQCIRFIALRVPLRFLPKMYMSALYRMFARQ